MERGALESVRAKSKKLIAQAAETNFDAKLAVTRAKKLMAMLARLKARMRGSKAKARYRLSARHHPNLTSRN